MDYAINALPSQIRPIKFPRDPKGQKDALARCLQLSGHRMLEFTESGLKGFGGIVATLESLDLFDGDAEYSDIWSAAKAVVQELLSVGQMPDDSAELIQLVRAKVQPLIKVRRYVVPIHGVSLSGIDTLQLGALRLLSPSLDALKHAGADVSHSHVEPAFDAMGQDPWIIGDATGTDRVAAKRFRSHAELAVGLLAIFASANYENGATRFRIGLRIAAEQTPSRSTFLSWGNDDGSVTVHGSSGRSQPLRFDLQLEERLREGGLFDRAFLLIGSRKCSPLEDAILRAIFWFSDAQRDSVPVMQFVKYWSCVETFFSTPKDVVRSVSTGLATVLVAGGFGFFPPSDYADLKRRIRKLYTLRCRALHGGSYRHVTERDVAELSQWTAWMVINMLSFVERGYKTSEEVRVQTERLDGVLTRGSTSAAATA